MPTNRFSATVIVSVLLVLAVLGARAVKSRWLPGSGPSAADNKSKGPADAQVKIVEYTDFECPACALGSKATAELIKKFPGKIFLQYRHFPLSGHKNSTALAIAVECAAQQGEFWPFHDVLFEKQSVLRNSLRIEGRLMEIAQQLGLDIKTFEACQKDPDTELTVIRMKKEGESLGVSATPTYFLNGTLVVGPGELKRELEKILGKAP